MEFADGQSLVISLEVVPDCGEDSFAVQTGSLGGFLCVTDGCGGIGSRRYASLNRTEAYMAARLSAQCVQTWATELETFPTDASQAALAAQTLKQSLTARLRDFHAAYRTQEKSLILRSGMQRTLPSTLCAALLDARSPEALACVFFWAGDSRGYVLDGDGLRQCTADHLLRASDPMDNLYRESRLSNMVNADADFTIDAYGLRLNRPCVVIAATDGAFGYLPTPMEFELLLLSALQNATSLKSWQNRLQNALRKFASDDCTLTLVCYGYADFETLKQSFAERKQRLQHDFVTPVRRRKQSVDYARGLWEDYRRHYELREEDRRADWRL